MAIARLVSDDKFVELDGEFRRLVLEFTAQELRLRLQHLGVEKSVRVVGDSILVDDPKLQPDDGSIIDTEKVSIDIMGKASDPFKDILKDVFKEAYLEGHAKAKEEIKNKWVL